MDEEEKKIAEYYKLMGIFDYCCGCPNFTPEATKFIKDDGTGVINWIYCGRQHFCDFVQNDLKEQEEWERTHRYGGD